MEYTFIHCMQTKEDLLGNWFCNETMIPWKFPAWYCAVPDLFHRFVNLVLYLTIFLWFVRMAFCITRLIVFINIFISSVQAQQKKFHRHFSADDGLPKFRSSQNCGGFERVYLDCYRSRSFKIWRIWDKIIWDSWRFIGYFNSAFDVGFKRTSLDDRTIRKYLLWRGKNSAI